METVETFDRSRPYEMVAADLVIDRIASLCHVEIDIVARIERTLFGGPKPVRLLSIAGEASDIQHAVTIYNALDDEVARMTAEFKARHRGYSDREVEAFQQKAAYTIMEQFALREAPATTSELPEPEQRISA